jgi:hypothetical protein
MRRRWVVALAVVGALLALAWLVFTALIGYVTLD